MSSKNIKCHRFISTSSKGCCRPVLWAMCCVAGVVLEPAAVTVYRAFLRNQPLIGLASSDELVICMQAGKVEAQSPSSNCNRQLINTAASPPSKKSSTNCVNVNIATGQWEMRMEGPKDVLRQTDWTLLHHSGAPECRLDCYITIIYDILILSQSSQPSIVWATLHGEQQWISEMHLCSTYCESYFCHPYV